MKIKSLIKLLEKYENKNVEVNLKLIPNDGSEEDTDKYDLDIKCVGVIYNGLDYDKPFIEIGFS